MVGSFASGCLHRILILHETQSRELWTFYSHMYGDVVAWVSAVVKLGAKQGPKERVSELEITFSRICKFAWQLYCLFYFIFCSSASLFLL